MPYLIDHNQLMCEHATVFRAGEKGGELAVRALPLDCHGRMRMTP